MTGFEHSRLRCSRRHEVGHLAYGMGRCYMVRVCIRAR